MKTLLRPGDMIRIRKDISQGVSYGMLNDDKITNSWIEDDMLPPGTLVEIVDIIQGQYVVHALDFRRSKYTYDDDFWLYTDQMFDPDMLIMLIGSMVGKDYLNL